MKIVYNNIIPFKGFRAINLFGILFVREGATMRDEDFNHESIHTEQMKDMLFIFFYVWYVIEYIIKLFYYGNSHDTYRAISFEREAYNNQNNLNYLDNRKHYSWLRYIFV